MNRFLISTIVRKGLATFLQLPRGMLLLASNEEKYLESPPVLVNSFPKSGTHLLLQMMRAMPNRRHFGSFIASTPSLSMRERSDWSYSTAIKRIVPAEAVPAHLYYSEQIARLLAEKNVIHYFIYRDPRDVVLSEAMYLTYMTRFHRLHSIFRRLPNDECRIEAAICGLEDLPAGVSYPDVATRFNWYAGWLESKDVHPVRFEDLRGPNLEQAVRSIVEHYNSRAEVQVPPSETVRAMIEGVDPSSSHTFRKGKVGGWRDRFTERHVAKMKDIAGSLLIELGYEQDFDWGLEPN